MLLEYKLVIYENTFQAFDLEDWELFLDSFDEDLTLFGYVAISINEEVKTFRNLRDFFSSVNVENIDEDFYMKLQKFFADQYGDIYFPHELAIVTEEVI